MLKFNLGFLVFLFIGCLLLGISSCKHSPLGIDPSDITPSDPTGNGSIDTTIIDSTQMGRICSPDTVYFDQQILPILQSSCAFSGCHDAASAQDGVVLTNYERVMQTADIRPFRTNDSELYEVITENDPDDVMPPPPASRLTGEQIALIATWINQGAQNLQCDPDAGSCTTNSRSYNTHIRPILQNRCVGCHSGGSPSGGVSLNNYTGVLTVVNSGQLLGAIRQETGFANMPPNGNALPQCTIDQIAAWIQDGAPNN